MNRRNLLMTAGTGFAAVAAATGLAAATTTTQSNSRSDMHLLQTKDGTRLYWRQWGTGSPVVFVHSWALNSDMWQYQTTEFAEHGLRCITYDRRGHGRSDQPSHGYDTDTLADDLALVMDSLDISNAILVGHYAPPGEPTFRNGWPVTRRRSSRRIRRQRCSNGVRR